MPVGPPDVNENRVRVVQKCACCGGARLVTMAFREEVAARPWGPVGEVWYADMARESA